MLSINWQAAAAYEHADNISAAGFAWEYLRRDDEYWGDYEKVTRGPSSKKLLRSFTQRWGLRFPARS